jgi:hypothetical protein
MSYVVQIWENPTSRALPASIDEAVQLLDELHEARSEQNPKFIFLAQRLTSRYPCMCSPTTGAEDDDEEISPSDYAWSDGPIDGRTNAAVYKLGLNVGLLEEVQPFVVQEANALGLCVMDGQAGEAYLPGGKVLSLSRPAASRQPTPQKNYDDVPKNKVLAQLVFARLTPLMAKHGYKARKSDLGFKRIFPNGWHEISVYADVDMWPLHAEFQVIASIRFHAVSDLVAAIVRPDYTPYMVKQLNTALTSQREWMDDENGNFIDKHNNKCYVLRSYSEVDAAVEHLLMKLETRLLPILKKSETIEGLDSLLNTEPLPSSPFGMKEGGIDNIIVAFLANNPRLEKLCDELSAKFANSNRADRTRRCVEYVRKQSSPKA